MLAKRDLQPILKDFKAKIVEIGSEKIILETNDERHEELKTRLQEATKLSLKISGIRKEEKKNIIEFIVTAKSPTEEILDIFSKYYEGVSPADEGAKPSEDIEED